MMANCAPCLMRSAHSILSHGFLIRHLPSHPSRLAMLAAVLCEALSWDLVSFLSGLCHTATGAAEAKPASIIAAQGLLQSILMLSYTVPQGINRGTATLIGNAVGAGDASRAASGSRLGTALGLVSAAVLVAIVALLRVQIVSVFGAPEAVAQIVVAMLPLVAGFLFCDCMQMVLTVCWQPRDRALFGAQHAAHHVHASQYTRRARV